MFRLTARRQAPRYTNHLVVLQHGSHGSPADMSYLKDVLVRCDTSTVRLPGRPNGPGPNLSPMAASTSQGRSEQTTLGEEVTVPFHVWATPAVSGRATDAGLNECCDAVAGALHGFIQSNCNPRTEKWLVSCVGHSWGGLLMRRVMAHISKHPDLCNNITFRTYVSVASPHLGVQGMKFKPVEQLGTYLGTSGRSQTYKELFSAGGDATLNKLLCNDQHLAALRNFHHRASYAALDDSLVPFQSASLMTPSEIEHFVEVGLASGAKENKDLYPHIRAKQVLERYPWSTKGCATEQYQCWVMRHALRSVGRWNVFPVEAFTTPLGSGAASAHKSTSEGGWNRRLLQSCPPSLSMHRAIMCKSPFNYVASEPSDPLCCGEVCRHIAYELLGGRKPQ